MARRMHQDAQISKLSAAKTHRQKLLQSVEFWRNQKDLTPEDQRLLENSWDSRHWMHFSRNNDILPLMCRDYFDRPRYIPPETGFEIKQDRLATSWLLKEPLEASLRPHTSPLLERSFSTPEMKPLEDGWNDHFHCTHSASNHLYHENNREYFSTYCNGRSKQVLPRKQRGLEKHYFPRRSVCKLEGVDDPPSLAETLLMPNEPISLPSLPNSLMRALSSSAF